MQPQLPAAARQAQNKHGTATTIPQCKASSSRFIFLSLLGELVFCTGSARYQDNFVFEITQYFLWTNFTGIVLFPDKTTAAPSIPVFAGFHIGLCVPWPHRSKSPSLVFNPLINNSSPVLRAVTSRKELDTRFWGTRMLGLPMGFGMGQLLS